MSRRARSRGPISWHYYHVTDSYKVERSRARDILGSRRVQGGQRQLHGLPNKPDEPSVRVERGALRAIKDIRGIAGTPSRSTSGTG